MKIDSHKILTGTLAALGSLFLLSCEKAEQIPPKPDEYDISISLPKAETGEQSREIGEIIINIRENGEIIVNQEIMPMKTLKQRLELIASEFPDQGVILRGDANARLQKIVDVLDLVKSAEIWNVAIATSKPE